MIPLRIANRSTLIPLLRQATVLRTTREWVSLLEAQGVPCGPINRLDDVFADEQVVSRGMRIEMPHAQAGCVALVANPIRLSESPVSYRLAPPTLGQHTGEVLIDWLSLDSAAMADLRADNVI